MEKEILGNQNGKGEAEISLEKAHIHSYCVAKKFI